MQWNTEHNTRIMPWKGEKDPYKIWLSEIILQQTRVEQGLEYYQRFVRNYPTVDLLAAAEDDDVFKLWEGLGYYSRCKNLLASARKISFESANVFPADHEAILQLKGVGPYTAAAIASFAYNLPHAVLDGNVFRLLARFFGVQKAIDSTEGKKHFTALANKLLDKNTPALYNQAIMDFGATVCKPKPLCEICILQQQCTAFNKGLIDMLPVKEKKLRKRQRYFYYIVAEFEGHIYVNKRQEKDIWQNLWEFVLFEQEEKISEKAFLRSTGVKALLGKKFALKAVSPFYRQQLTHQTIEGIFISVVLTGPPAGNEFTAILKSAIRKLAFPKLITAWFEDRQSF